MLKMLGIVFYVGLLLGGYFEVMVVFVYLHDAFRLLH